ncbi:energy transducer TonB [Novosphingobium guangzhouense]|uniref:Protein TonB n=1 Tax=Novosphingobium guangzhouense TaxID=1850347 RepID=A0A2K2G5I5_9SPHN|nr:energy transducer TonB [Novosphingobium guangzhouense]PNU06294.1 energy transducer TonB [Novosphingobium guangzhouense]
MATVAALAPDERAFAPVSAVGHAPSHLHEFGDSSAEVMGERSVYAPNRANPVALVASVAMILGMGACLATLNMVAAHKQRTHLLTVDVRELDVTPPPPPEPTKLETPQAAVTQTVAPRPMIELPSPGPQQVMVDAPPPPAPPVVTSEGVKVSAPPAVAPAPAATTLEGGDLSSKVLFAKPPTYPVDARRAHEQGTVKLLLLVGSDGTVKDIQVAASSGSSRLDGAALRAVKRWRWSPMMANGIATAVRGYVTIPFVLTNV